MALIHSYTPVRLDTWQVDNEQVEPGKIYVLQNGDLDLDCVKFLCPCGCAQVVYLPVHVGGDRQQEHEWGLLWHPEGTLSLYPSIQQRGGCNSHYHIWACVTNWSGPPPAQ